MKRNTVVFQGTFDPFTQGHLSVLKDALGLFDQAVVLLLVNPAKKPLFSVEERLKLIRDTVSAEGLCGVSADAYEGLLADYMRARDLLFCVRGVRGGRDAEYEMENHRLSRVFYPALQTLLLPCREPWAEVSSSAVKAACAAGRLPEKWVSPAVRLALQERYPGLTVF